MASASNKRVVVIGAGIVGASLAYHLAGQGAQVTVLEAGEIASGVTGTSFAWLNTTHGAGDPIAHLRGTAIAEYHRLQAELPDLQIRWSGALSYGVEANGMPPATLVSRGQIRKLEPNLKHPPEQAWHAAAEGALDAVAATHALLAGAQAHGAQVFTYTPVLGFLLQGSTVTGVKTATGAIAADMVVLAAGTGTARLAAMLDTPLPVTASPAIFIRYKTANDLVKGILSSPQMEVRQGADGSLLAAEDYLDDTPDNHPAAIAVRTAQAIGHELHGVTAIETELACVGWRPMPADGVPIVGHLPHVSGAYVCVMHPGVILAAVVGRLASEEIITGKAASTLAPCRPDRFSPHQIRLNRHRGQP
ncbi:MULTISPECIES: FAD-binding oxidoreductase [unclassified Janthinobacterium]|uniref:NAD(P)/FAD-dependent oxidoreductase n=1 Tax=unclassified Janthinobacterium TaxID=2610881 RepID=UPI00160C433C|nr:MULTISPECIES: FAD-binding oxidoreductase [unclassified Janthinobacterium]MBB5610806.1 glycine/D-amino acid oxidase-like deaminating enzyme [Janthinobacterium sp. S3T4]MBB5616292.1 glycine/D-amino acid oxidase-like deaminating enzyme [Janthinobacterium sp. S3M3]